MTKTLWALLDNRRGSVGQALGVIQALDKSSFEIVEKKIDYNKLSGLPNWIRGKTLLGLTNESKKLITAPFPDYVLSISRRTAPIARYIKKCSPDTKIIQLMHPGNTGINEFSLIVVPEHDKNKKSTPNTKYIIGCPHRVTPEYLAEAKEKWQNTFANLPRPITALIIGGSIKGKPFSNANATALARAVKTLKRQIGGSLLITTSRRTGKEAEDFIMQELHEIPQYDYLWGDNGDNPYAGFLACADNIVVTADSVSMCCEATGTGKPIYLFTGKNWLTPKHLRFAQSLCDKKCAIMIENITGEPFKPETQINAAQDIANWIAKL